MACKAIYLFYSNGKELIRCCFFLLVSFSVCVKKKLLCFFYMEGLFSTLWTKTETLSSKNAEEEEMPHMNLSGRI